jgi:hypothetical protein
MNEFLVKIIDAHGGTDRWHWNEKVEATIVSGGGFFALKGVPQDANPRRMTVWLHEERSSVSPYGAPDQRTMFTPERIAIEKLDGTNGRRALCAEGFVCRPPDEHAVGPAASCLLQTARPYGPISLLPFRPVRRHNGSGAGRPRRARAAKGEQVDSRKRGGSCQGRR